MTFNVKDFGAMGDGLTDDLASFNAALSSMYSNVNGGGVLLIPEGNYFLSNTLILKHRVEMTGFTGREANNAINYNFIYDDDNGVRKVNADGILDPNAPFPSGISRLMFPRGTTGILVALAGSNNEQHAEGTIIRNLSIVSAISHQSAPLIFTPPDPLKDPASFNAPVNFAHGISVKARVLVSNCFIANFTGNGIHIVAPSQPPQTDDGQRFYDIKNPWLGNLYTDNVFEGINYNANTIDSKFINTAVIKNGLNGVYIIGSNSGNMLFEHIYSSYNKRYGFFDSERATGNTYLNCYSEINDAGEYYCLGTGLLKDTNDNYYYAGKGGSGSVYLNCYQEAQGSAIYPPAMIIEGQVSLDGYNTPVIDQEFLDHYKIITGVDMPDSPFGGAKASVLRQAGASNGCAGFPGGINAIGGDDYRKAAANKYKVAIDIGGIADATAIMLTSIQPTASTPLSLVYQNNIAGWWAMISSNAMTQRSFCFSTAEAPEGANQFWLPNGFFIGENPNRNKVISSNYDNGVLTADMATHRVGDIILNDDPVIDHNKKGYAGYMCVEVTGNKVWAGFGKLELPG